MARDRSGNIPLIPTQSASEIVHILNNKVLLDSGWHIQNYVTLDNQPLLPGFYFAFWPANGMPHSYQQETYYFGPFQTKQFADQLRSCGISHGIIKATEKTQNASWQNNQQQLFIAPDKRRSFRKSLSSPGLLICKGYPPIKIQTIDVSTGGLGATIHKRLNLGQICMLTFQLPWRGKQRSIALIAEVAYCLPVWQKNFKIGLKFIEIEANGAALIADYMHE